MKESDDYATETSLEGVAKEQNFLCCQDQQGASTFREHHDELGIQHLSVEGITQRFQLCETIGQGGFGQIYQGVDLFLPRKVAAKMDARPSQTHLLSEIRHYRRMLTYSRRWQVKICPDLYAFCVVDHPSLMVMELMGPSLSNLFFRSNRKFPVVFTARLAIALISVLQRVHACGIVHGDVKPGNFVMAPGKSGLSRIAAIDFGLSTLWRKADGSHVTPKYSSNFRGTYRYASINAHVTSVITRRDDLEALAYILIYFVRGSLPWQNIRDQPPNMSKHAYIAFLKIHCSMEELCSGLPAPFQLFLAYSRSLDFHCKPDYVFCRNLFEGIATQPEIGAYEVAALTAVSRRRHPTRDGAVIGFRPTETTDERSRSCGKKRRDRTKKGGATDATPVLERRCRVKEGANAGTGTTPGHIVAEAGRASTREGGIV